MLTHMVVWKYREDIPAATRAEHVEKLRGLREIVAGIESLTVGFDTLHLPRSYDTGLVAVFHNRAALDEYTLHPEHVKVADFGRSLSANVASVDFES